MTEVSYVLTNGKEVHSLKEAQLSGQGYRISYRPTKEQPKTKATYILTNGEEVNSLREARMSGQGYSVVYKPMVVGA